MIDETEVQKLKNDYPEFFKALPPELVDFIFSEKTAEKITGICKSNNVVDEAQIEGIAYRITLVLFKKLPGENLAMTIESGLGLKPEIARKIADEANQFIASAMAQWKPKEVVVEPPKEELPPKPPSNDTYREKIE